MCLANCKIKMKVSYAKQSVLNDVKKYIFIAHLNGVNLECKYYTRDSVIMKS